MATARRRSICSRAGRLAVAPPEHEAEVLRRQPVPQRLLLRGAGPEVVVALTESSTQPPRFAHCCKTRRQRGSLRSSVPGYTAVSTVDLLMNAPFDE